MNFSIPGLVEAATEIASGLERLSQSVLNHRVQAPQTKEQFAYQMMIATVNSGASNSRIASLEHEIDDAWAVLQQIRLEEQ